MSPRCVVSDGQANGVRLGSGETIAAARGVICSVTPTQLYERLLAAASVDAATRKSTSAYRYGKGDMQIHYALKSPPRWKTPELGNVALLHLTPGLDGVSKAVNECERGMLPETPTICVGQPHALDPSRCPPGAGILWIQLPEAAAHHQGRRGGRDRGAGGWKVEPRPSARPTPTASRRSSRTTSTASARMCVARRAYSPADLEAMNINLVGGDPYGGSSTIDQVVHLAAVRELRNHDDGRCAGSTISARRPIRAPGSPAARALRWRSGSHEPRRTDALPAGRRPGGAARNRLPTLGEIGLDRFAPYLLNRIVARWNDDLAARAQGARA